MKKIETEFSSSRRDSIKKLALGSTAGLLGLLGSPIASAQERPENTSYKNGMPPVKIRSVKAIATAPKG